MSKRPETMPETSTPSPGRRTGRRCRFFLAGLAVLAGLVYAAPWLIGRMFLHQSTMAWLSRDFANIEVGDATLSWQSPVMLTDVTVKDPQGQPVAKVASVTSQRSLWDMLTKPDRPIHLDFEGFTLSVLVFDPEPPQGRPDLYLLTRELQFFEMPQPLRYMTVNITNGRIEFRNLDREIVDIWKDISAHYRYERREAVEQALEVTMPATSEAGELTLSGLWTQSMQSPGAESLILAGEGSDVSLAAVDHWLQEYLGEDHPLERAGGRLTGSFHRDRQSGWSLQVSAQLHGAPAPLRDIEEVSFIDSEQPTVDIELETHFSRPRDELTIPKLSLVAEDVTVAVSGTVSQLASREMVDISGEIRSPGLTLVDLLPPSIRDHVHVVDARFSEMTIRGPLEPGPGGQGPPFELSLVASWDAAEAFGLSSKTGRLRLTYSENRLRAEPLNVVVNDGRLRRLPEVDLSSDPPRLLFTEGVLLEEVALSEEVCRGWLKYLSPALANATSADGRFTLSVGKGAVRLGDLNHSDLAGTLAIHQARVRPGPVAVDLMTSVNQFRELLTRKDGRDPGQQVWMTVPSQEVAFQVREGRVHHDRFAARVGDVGLETSGSVGLDETLALTAAVGLPSSWFENAGTVLRALEEERIELAVGGTVNAPRVDNAPLLDFGRRAGVKAGTGLLQRIIERGLERGR